MEQLTKANDALSVSKGYKQTEVGIIPSDWNIIRLGDYISLKNGYAFKSEYFSSNGPIVMTPGNFKLEGGLKFNKRNTIRYSGEYLKHMCFENGDLIMVMTDLTPDCNLLGKSGIVDSKEIILHNQRIGKIVITKKGILKDYLNIYFNSFLFSNRMKSTATGSTVRHTSVPAINNSKVILPPLAEQKAIATVLSDTDALLQALEKKIAKKKLIKKGVMQELLTPKEGWVRVRLDEVLKFGSGEDYKHLSEGDIPVYGTGGIMTYVNDFLYNGDSVGIGRKGTIDKPVLLCGKFWTVDTLFYTHTFMNTTPKFIYYKFLMIPWLDYNEASGVPSLNKNTLGKIEIDLPQTISEQNQIAQILSDMDQEIEALEQKLSKYQLAKQGMMQQLLTGKIRLV